MSAPERKVQLFRQIIGALPVAAALSVVVGERARLLVNPKFVTLFGLTEEDIAGSDAWCQSAFPDGGERARIEAEWNSRHAHPLDSERPAVSMEAQMSARSGTPLFVEIFFSHLRGASLVAFVDISERKRAEAVLRRNQLHLDLALQAAKAGTWELDLSTLMQSFGQSYDAMLGYAEGEVPRARHEWLKLVHPDDLPNLEAADRMLLALENDYRESEFRIRAKDGAWRWILSRCRVAASDEGGRPMRLLGVDTDITARKYAELALQSERDRSQRYLDIAGLMIVALNPDGTVALLNRKGCEILGVSEAQALGRNWFDSFVPAAEREKRRAQFAAFLRNPRTDYPSMEMPVETRTGETRVISWNHTLLRADDGTIVGGMGSGVEITDQRAAEQKRDEFRALLEATAEASPDGIMVSDATGRYLFWNKRYREMWRLSDDYIRVRQAGPPLTTELLKPFTDQLENADIFVKNSIDILVHGQLPEPISDELALKDGRTFIRYAAMVSPSKLPFTAIAWVYRDITEQRRQAQAAYRALEEVSLTDPLTGLRNRRFLQQHMEADVALTLRYYEQWLRHPAETLPATADMVFFLIDLDHFKSVNDRYGHGVGDQVLVQMRQRLQEVFRASDHLVRWGGEEFLVVARAVNREEAEGVAERVRKAVAGREFELGQDLRLAETCSIGFACFPFLPYRPRLLSWSEVVELADQGLYIAKRRGRNAWVGLIATERTPPEAAFERLKQNPEEAARKGELRLATNLSAESEAGSRTPAQGRKAAPRGR
ncbi:MAG TPA: PAS domain S-box protein [Alphaproteobacteria bacterium]|nr:PAS domain S-box protein [Alphaproteobacteria bacterium]